MTHSDHRIPLLADVGLLEFLERDERPSFIFDLDKKALTAEWSLKVVYRNPSLRSYNGFLPVLLGNSRDAPPFRASELEERSFFEHWITNPRKIALGLSGPSERYVFRNITWTRTMLRSRWVVVTGLSIEPCEMPPPITPWSIFTQPAFSAGAGLASKIGDYPYKDEAESHSDRFDTSIRTQSQYLSRSKSLSYDEILKFDTESKTPTQGIRGNPRGPDPNYNIRSLDELAVAPEPSNFWEVTLWELDRDRLDVPFAIAYSLDRPEDPTFPDANRVISLKAAVGIPRSHSLLPQKASIDQSDYGLMQTFRQAMDFEGPRFLRIDGNKLPRKVLQRNQAGEVWTDVVVTRLSFGFQTFGFILIGLNPRRHFDDAYKRFSLLLSKQLATSLTSLVLLNEAKLTETGLTAMAAQHLRTAAEIEQRFKSMAELSPVGMYYLSPVGEIIYANDSYFRLTGHSKGLFKEMSFVDLYLDEEKEVIAEEWHKLTVLKLERTFELRLKKKWYHEATNEWKGICVLASAIAEFNDDGTAKNVIGVIADISAQKQAEEDALERARLSEEVALKAQQAREFEMKFRRMAEISPIGMYETTITGEMIWANSTWCNMTGHESGSEDYYAKSFHEIIDPADRGVTDREWTRLAAGQKEIKFEFRTLRPWINLASGKPVPEPTWMLAMAVPEFGDDGSFRHVFGTLTDISQLKWSEALERRNRIEADEARESQEKFMDIISHEIRNPLSAIIQSADGISSLSTESESLKDPKRLREIANSNLEAAQIITLCAQHQGRIINDVLTLSKLDSGMLVVDLIPTKPVSVVKQNLQMFEGELASHGTTMELVVDNSWQSHGVDWVLADPSRISQIFINLLTNAIKFTKLSPARTITVKLFALLNKPQNELGPIEWFPSRLGSPKLDVWRTRELVREEYLYLAFTVQDTGTGLSSQDKTRLFHRFSQANPRTHTLYGGSGLGLFICRELAELQGGGIGVASEVGKGSTFAFFIKATRAVAPIDKHLEQVEDTTQPRRYSIQSQKVDGFALSQVTAETKVPSRPEDLDRHHKKSASPNVILLVEDNLINQKVLKSQLRKAGYVVHVANHGVEALSFLRTTTFWNETDGTRETLHVVLMDVEMPVMGGLACVREIRSMQQQGQLTRHVPVIAITANVRQAQIDMCLAAGMDDFVAKPFRLPDLISKMARFFVDAEDIQGLRDLPSPGSKVPGNGPSDSKLG